MATFLSSSSALVTLPYTPKVRSTNCQLNTLSTIRGPMIGRLRLVPKIQITKAHPKMVQSVQGIIANQLSIDESTVTPQTKFADLGADSLDIVEILMALEETFGVSIGEGNVENISKVQDAADLIEKVKLATT